MSMSEGLQQLASRRRPDRQISSCTECRRRKQKCSQGQPCTNCVRRFPQPVCEYIVKAPVDKLIRTVLPTLPERQPTPVAVKDGPYSHLNTASSVQDAILQVEDSTEQVLSASSAASIYSHLPSTSGNDPSPVTPFVPFKTPPSEDNDPLALLETLRVIFERRLIVTSRLPKEENDWSSEEAHSMIAAHSQRNVSAAIEGAMEQFRFLPMAPTKMNKELVRIHLQLLCRFKVSVDGSPGPNNQFMKYWVPFCVQDPLLLQIVLFTSACFFSETGHIPKTLAMMHKGKVYQLLNQYLRTEGTQTSDASILGVAQMVIDSWYWGGTSDLKAHIKGLKQMITLRGGPQKLGMHGFIAKTVLIHDAVMALAHEIEPEIYGKKGFEFEDSIMMPFHVGLNTPLIFGWPSFTACANSLRLHPFAATILDDMRMLIEAVISLPEEETEEDLHNIVTAAGWVSDRLAELPDDIPSRQSPEYASPATESDSQSSGSGRSPRSNHSSPPVEVPDMMYRVVRNTANVYCRAILNRTPTSEICSEIDFLKTWQAVWVAGLPAWKTAIGIFVWVMLGIVPSCHKTGPARFVKTLMVAGFMTIGVDNWHIAMDALRTGFQLQRWLAGEHMHHDEKGLSGGEHIVDRYGFAMKEIMPNVDLPLDDE